jgi:hypothetical protein
MGRGGFKGACEGRLQCGGTVGGSKGAARQC